MSEVKIGRIVEGALSTNCYFVYRQGQSEVIFFDPADHGKRIFERLTEKGFRIAAICLTHAHFDHIWGLKELADLTGAEVYALDREKELCEDISLNVSARFRRPVTARVDHYLKDGDRLEIAGVTADVIATPGHTQGSCCYYFEEGKILVSGDTLFYESTGRTDFPTGSGSQLVHSIQDRLFILPDDTAVFPGHGEQTTIGHEKKYNPFVAISGQE